MEDSVSIKTEQILGIPFFNGTAAEAVARIAASGGLLVAPSGTCFERFLEDADYRRAIVSADVVLPDSGAMVTLWRLLHRRSINRISGLTYLKQLLAVADFEQVFWVLPNERAQEKLIEWAEQKQLSVIGDSSYCAPMYGKTVEDETLLSLIESRQPAHIIIAVGAGAQEKLGWYLRENLRQDLRPPPSAFRAPTIHCIGGALGFVTGDQVAIPDWADRLYLGWFLRLLSRPQVMVPRLWKARVLPWLILRYGSTQPPFRS